MKKFWVLNRGEKIIVEAENFEEIDKSFLPLSIIFDPDLCKLYNSNWETRYLIGGKIWLKDFKGVVREIYTDKLSEIIYLNDWDSYDYFLREKLIKELELIAEKLEVVLEEKNETIKDGIETIDLFYQGLCSIYNVNSVGGSGSRRKVREIIHNLGIKPLINCNKN